MADQQAGSQKIQVKVLDAATGKELSSHEMIVAPGTRGFCSCSTCSVTTVDGPPQRM